MFNMNEWMNELLVTPAYSWSLNICIKSLKTQIKKALYALDNRMSDNTVLIKK